MLAVGLAMGLMACIAVATAAANCGSILTYPTTGSMGSTNPAEPDIRRCFKADPINCATGNLTEAHMDLAVQGHGPALQVARYYNSQVAATQGSPGSFGYGWSSSYSAKLTFTLEKTVATITHDNGSTITFALSGTTGQWNAPVWTQATFAKSGENYVYTQPDYTKLEFTGSGRLLKITDRHNLSLTLAYNGSGRLETVTDQASRKLTFAYNASGQVEKITDPMGRVATYTYLSGNLASVTLPGVATPRWKFAYNGFHELTSLTNGRGYITTTTYDTSHRATSQIDPLGRKYSFAYKETSGIRETTVTEPNGAVTLEKFNEAGSPTSITHGVGTSLEATSTYVYNSSFLVTSATDPNKHTTTYTYDGHGNKLTEKDPNGNETKWTYNSTNDVIGVTNPKGQVTTITRSVAGDPTAIKRVFGTSTQEAKFVYNEWGDLTQRTDPAGRSRFYLYLENNGLPLFESSSALFSKETILHGWIYDLDGEIEKEVDGRAYESGNEESQFTTTITRDTQGRPIITTDPLGNRSKVSYDLNGNVQTLTDGNGHATSYVYDSADQRIEVKSANGAVTKITYDSMGDMASRSNGNGNTTEYKHDLLGRVTEAIDPLGRKTIYAYDLGGNLVKATDAEGRSTAYSYDSGNRLTKTDYSDPATADVSIAYDKDGNVIEMTDGTGTTKRVYDALDRPIEVVNGKSEIVKYEYNLASDITKLTYPNGKAITRSFDGRGRLEKVVDWLGKETKFSYYRNSLLRSTTFPNETGNVDEYTYNTRGDLTKTVMTKGAEVLASLAYGRDKAGQLTSTVQKGVPGQESLSYEYDAGNRLVKGGGTLFEYDLAGNRTKVTEAGWVGSYTYDAASQLVSGPEMSFSFNKMGQRVKYSPAGVTPTTYAYDQAGNLTSVQRSAEFTNPINETYKYDGSGLRVSESVAGTTYSMVWDITEKLPTLLNDGRNSYIYGPDGLPIEQINSQGQALYLHHDQEGSTRLLTGSTGKVEGAYGFGPYGELRNHTGTAVTLLGYRGEYRSETSGLIYLRARVYDPETAQFLSVDPMVAVSEEPYGYAADNPTNIDDPSGLYPYSDGCPCPPCRMSDPAQGPAQALPDITILADRGPTASNMLSWDPILKKWGPPLAGIAAGMVFIWAAPEVIGTGIIAIGLARVGGGAIGALVNMRVDALLNDRRFGYRDVVNRFERASYRGMVTTAVATTLPGGWLPKAATLGLGWIADQSMAVQQQFRR